METSAPTNRRERKMQETAQRLTAVTRRLTAERGLGGFTVDEVCEEVDVSRRTFFNYFPSKEDAVLGANPEDELQRLREQFLARGSRGWSAVLGDLVDLVISSFEVEGINAEGHAQLMAAVEREPRLLLKFMGVGRDRERQAAALVAEREQVSVDDVRAQACVNLLTTLLKVAGEQYLTLDNTREFSEILHEQLAALRAVLSD